MKIQKNPKKNPETEKNPENIIIISYLISQLFIMWRNMVKTIEIWRFKKNDKKNRKKEIFNLWSFAHEVKSIFS